MIVEAARLHVDEIAGLALLTGGEKPRRIHAGLPARSHVIGMRIPFHVVRPRVAVDEQHAPAR